MMATRSPVKRTRNSSCSTRGMWPLSRNPARPRIDSLLPGPENLEIASSCQNPYTLSFHIPRKEFQSQFPTKVPDPWFFISHDSSVQIWSLKLLRIQVLSPKSPPSQDSEVQRLNLYLSRIQGLISTTPTSLGLGISEVSFQSGVKL